MITPSESVWDYPRPPALRSSGAAIEIWLGGEPVCRTDRSWQVLETSHPPTYYLPRSSFVPGALRDATGSSFCEWKGAARYLDVVGGEQVAPRAAWWYPDPAPAYAALADHVALYAGPMDRVRSTARSWCRSRAASTAAGSRASVTGPFKGVPGSQGW